MNFFKSKIGVVLCAVSLCGLFAYGCGEDTEEYERPSEAREIISDDRLDEFTENGFTVHAGDSPPDLEGTYYFGDFEVLYSDSDIYPNFDNYCHSIRTYTQVDGAEYASTYESPNCEAEGEASGIYISGEDDCFTLYQESSGHRGNCETASESVLSACITSDGDLDDPHSGSYTTKMEGSDCESFIEDGLMKAEGEMSISRRQSGVAERVD